MANVLRWRTPVVGRDGAASRVVHGVGTPYVTQAAGLAAAPSREVAATGWVTTNPLPARVTAALYGAQAPQNVLVTVDLLLIGDELTVYRVYAGADREPVRGGIEVSPGTVLLLGDVQAPFGRPVIYQVEIIRGGVSFTVESNPVTIPIPGDHVLSDPFTGRAIIGEIKADSDGWSQPWRGSVLRPAGRERPIVLFDVRADDEGSLTFKTLTREDTKALKALLASGNPIVSRIGNTTVDWSGTQVLSVMDVARHHQQPLPVTDAQTWVLPYVVTDDPDPDRAVSLATLQDIADAYPGGTLADIAADFPGGTLLDIAQHDWTLGPP